MSTREFAGRQARQIEEAGPLPTTTVVIPTRNRLSLLRESVCSILDQAGTQWELVVVDDASDDGTAEWISHLQDPRVRAIRLDHWTERTAARNRGLLAAKGQFILFLDDDDRLRPGALDILTRALREHPEAVAACGSHVAFNESGSWRSPWQALPIRFVRTIWPEVLFGRVPLQGECLFRADCLRRAGGWNESDMLVVAEDQDLWLRVGRMGPVAFVPETVMEYRAHAGQWRPADRLDVEDRIRDRFIASTEGEDLRITLSVIRAFRADAAGA